MTTIADKLVAIKNGKTAIAAAIEDKGVPVAGMSFSDYAGLIRQISSSSGCDRIFQCTYATTVPIDPGNALPTPLVVDGCTLSDGDTLLLMGQSAGHNGLYRYQLADSSGELLRLVDEINTQNLVLVTAGSYVRHVFSNAANADVYIDISDYQPDIPVSPDTGNIITRKDNGLYASVALPDMDVYATRAELNGKQDRLVFDDTPTADSANPVTSAGIKNHVDSTLGKIEALLEAMAEGGETGVVPFKPEYFIGTVENQVLTSPDTFSLDGSQANWNNVAENGLAYRFCGNPGLTRVYLPNVTELSGEAAFSNAFRYCPNLVSISFPALTRATGRQIFWGAFQECKNLKSVEFPNLEFLSGNVLDDSFGKCNSLQTISFPKLKTIENGSVFRSSWKECDALTSAYFDALESINADNAFENAFSWSRSLQTLSFPKLNTVTGKAVFREMTNGTDIKTLTFPELETLTNNADWDWDVTFKGTIEILYFPKLKTITGHYHFGSPVRELHFGAANRAQIESSDGYGTLWGLGAGNATVYFDLE